LIQPVASVRWWRTHTDRGLLKVASAISMPK
jgi:hypothetical protein